jgi:hypothetical protein
VYVPATKFAVKTAAVAIPAVSVVAVLTPPANVPPAPDEGAENVTTTLLTAFPDESRTVAAILVPNAVFTCVLCGVPAVAAMLAAGPGVFVNTKFAGVTPPPTDAVTVYVPAVAFAVNAAAVATPLVLVVAMLEPPANVPLAPLRAGAVKVTTTPLTGLFEASRTVTCSDLLNAVFTCALCGVPAVAAMLATDPGTLVKVYIAGVATPAATALTVYVPATAFAVNAAAVATPLASVVAVLTPPANAPLAPDDGAVNVTTTPLTGLFAPSLTVA